MASVQGSGVASLRWAICLAIGLLFEGVAQMPQASGDIVPGLMVNEVLSPSRSHHIKVGVGQTKFMRFSCMAGPADVVISLSTYSQHDDPILLLSMGLKESPSFLDHESSSFERWHEDALGGHFATARAVGPEGGILGLLNLKHFAAEELDGILSLRCSFIISFDALFWNHLRDSAICPIGLAPASEENGFCSGHGQCGDHGECVCDALFSGPACDYKSSAVSIASMGRYDVEVPTGQYHYIHVHVPGAFPGGFLDVKLHGDRPLVVLVSQRDTPTKGHYEMSNFEDWVKQRNESHVMFKVEALKQSSDQLPDAQFDPASQVIKVGVFHHRGGNKTLVDKARAVLDITLKTDPIFGFEDDVPDDWLGYLYNPFHDIRSLEVTQRDVYPDGDQFFYPIQLGHAKQLPPWDHSKESISRVRLFSERMTLLHIEHPSAKGAKDIGTEIFFEASPNISYVLTSSKRNPKTIFDFDQVILPAHGRVRIENIGRSSLWCAIFAKVDGYTKVRVRSFHKEQHSQPSHVGAHQQPQSFYVDVMIFFVICCLVVVLVAFKRHKPDNREQDVALVEHATTKGPTTTSLSRLVHSSSHHDESDPCITLNSSRTQSEVTEGGYGDSSVLLDRSVEEEYLNRGGFGDDGI